MSTELSSRVCETPGCNEVAKLQCPTCVKLGIQGSYFCSQDCFKGNWKSHKVLHKIAQGSGTSDKNGYDPWPYHKFTGALRPWPQTPKREVPVHIGLPDYAVHKHGIPLSEQDYKRSGLIKVLDDDEKEGLKVACKLGREVLDEAARVLDVGVTTDEIDRIVHEVIVDGMDIQNYYLLMRANKLETAVQACVERECYPSPLNYYEFPRSCCTSVNEVICHGIPDLRPLENGDICNVDVTVFHRGYHGDLNETFHVGEVSESAKKLVQVTWECLDRAIKIVRPGEKYREIGNVIQRHAQAHGFSVVRSYCGHGIHRLFHTAPSIPHYAKNKAVGVMKPGHSFTIEPMISQGSWRDELWPDKWTAVTIDGLLSAQFEHTLLVTETGCEILTQRSPNTPYFLDQDV